jgi:hypothetical protein
MGSRARLPPYRGANGVRDALASYNNFSGMPMGSGGAGTYIR